MNKGAAEVGTNRRRVVGTHEHSSFVSVPLRMVLVGGGCTHGGVRILGWVGFQHFGGGGGDTAPWLEAPPPPKKGSIDAPPKPY